ncbi:hypothetical protein Nepgr_028118 [Nepenthes gracilis]|uniref:RRM domain-containing protein n=1 Tax=Nepenthes gracilis TaxID=150966 RepID=A0AAD3TB39_NEPGR|nr:hypothetical protein Nepgr_028118 [Nepenthes gracilis]
MHCITRFHLPLGQYPSIPDHTNCSGIADFPPISVPATITFSLSLSHITSIALQLFIDFCFLNHGKKTKLQMWASKESADPRSVVNTQSTFNTNWTINVSDVKTVKVSNVSLYSSEKDIRELLSVSGEIQYVEMQRENEMQVAYVTFKDSQGADTAMLLSGATVADSSIIITPAESYQLPPGALPCNLVKEPPSSAVKKAEDIVSTMLAKGLVLGKDALNRARAFDEQHHWISTASAAVTSIDSKMGLSDKLTMGTSMVHKRAREVEERFHAYERTKSAFAAAEQTATAAGSAITHNHYVLTGASWISNAFRAVARSAEDVSTMTKEKVQKANEERMENLCRDRRDFISDFSEIHLDNSSFREPPVVPVDVKKLNII